VNCLDALSDHALVHLKLGLTSTAHANTALLSVQVSPAALQAAAEMLQLRQFNLQFAFMGAGALGENVQNQAGPVEHATFQCTLEITFLAGGKAVIEEHQFRLVGSHSGGDLFKLSGTDKVAG
jgi:hypothetical protein